MLWVEDREFGVGVVFFGGGGEVRVWHREVGLGSGGAAVMGRIDTV